MIIKYISSELMKCNFEDKIFEVYVVSFHSQLALVESVPNVLELDLSLIVTFIVKDQEATTVSGHNMGFVNIGGEVFICFIVMVGEKVDEALVGERLHAAPSEATR